jgi:hypothetical protein
MSEYDGFVTLVENIADAREFWRKALEWKPTPFPCEEQVKNYDPACSGAPIAAAFEKNSCAAELKCCRSLYFGEYETMDNDGLSGKILYIAGMDQLSLDPWFTADTIVWEPQWGHFEPPLFTMIARIEDGIDPSKELNLPLEKGEDSCGSITTVRDFTAANSGIERFNLSSEQTQYLNYFVTLAAAIAIVKAVLPCISFDGPVYAGFDAGDILHVR